MNLNKADLQREVLYKTSRSGGKGGQNVNKVSTKIELLFNIAESALFTDEQKAVLAEKLQARFNKDGLVQVICDEERSQFLNKEIALERLAAILGQALHKPKVRKPTKMSRAAKAARVDSKKRLSAKKADRRGGFGD
ncbi:aminoacyl-tRNA hydrolase [Mucilaginibacter achroorhodeus]|uniref:Aminoacyl-tRNA hydrolase n=2 Tax=Mucilaginibacter achroorhodeus TaxID=2599294 RepID=A0A563TWU4_9SPHI|nr:alternative ribosome rescue aminoacyl-tRNA hydrolase ArfB [Mucilaginibacter sp. 21P]QXV65189.1 aminoacyl-tRNA hydrolase [Mucilaginibacter sp. 21P]TWR23814.1 aminoacyl-tRNA hydrolase [Mucilaginibacter achroorhodeus]